MLEWVISSAALAALIIVLRFVLKGKISLRLQYALWMIVLLRLLVPVSFGSTGLSVMNAVESSEPYSNVIASLDTSALPYGTLRDTALSREDAEAEHGGTVYKIHGYSVESGKSELHTYFFKAPARKVIGSILTVVWVIGIAAVALWFISVNTVLFIKLRKTRVPVETTFSPLPVYVTGAVDTPCLFGFVHPAIYLTPNSCADETRMRQIITHELMHFRHFDHVWSLLRCVCLALHWFDPLVWWAAVLSRRDSELACDEATIKRLGEAERAEYGRTLIEMTCRRRPALLHTATTMTGGRSSIRERINMIAKKPKTAILTLVAVILIIAVAAGCTFTGSKKQEYTDEWFVTEAWPHAAEYAEANGLSISEDRYDVFRYADRKTADVVFPAEDGAKSISVSFTLEKNSKPVLLPAGAVNLIDRDRSEPTSDVPQTPPPSALPPLAEKRDYIMEDTFVISRDGDDFVVSSAGLDVTLKEVCDAYGRDINEDGQVEDEWANGKAPPVGGDIRFGMSYAEVRERLSGMTADVEPSMMYGTDYTNSYAGSLTRLRVQFDTENYRLNLIGFDVMDDDKAAAWFELYRRFTELLGEPVSSRMTDSFATPEELNALLEERDIAPAIAWGNEEKYLTLMLRPIGQGEIQLYVEMVWQNLMPGNDGQQEVTAPADASPSDVIDELFASGDIALTLYLANEGAQNTCPAGEWYAGRFKVLMSCFEWTALPMPLPEPSLFWLTAVSADGTESMTFWANGGAGMVQYEDGSEPKFWSAKAADGSGGSIANEVRFEYDNLEVDYSRISFSLDGSAEDAADFFVHSAYGSHMTTLSPGSMYGMSNYEVVEWKIREVSESGDTVVGTFRCAFTPQDFDSPAIWAGNTDYGTGQYQGKLTWSREFVLQKQDDGCWHCIDLGTGGAALPE